MPEIYILPLVIAVVPTLVFAFWALLHKPYTLHDYKVKV